MWKTLDWEVSMETYFEWKPMAENRKVLFVKLKLKGTAIQWWKRVEEQYVRQSNVKISTWEHKKKKFKFQTKIKIYLFLLLLIRNELE